MHYISAALSHLILFRLPPQMILLAIPVMMVMAFVAVLAHEGGHYVAGRAFGIRGRLVVFARRGVTRLWFMSLFAMDFSRTPAYAALSSKQRRVIIAAGPFTDLLLAIACLLCVHYYGISGGLIVASIQLLGILLLLMTVLMNIVPHAGKNDGWMFVWPDRSLTVRGD